MLSSIFAEIEWNKPNCCNQVRRASRQGDAHQEQRQASSSTGASISAFTLPDIRTFHGFDELYLLGKERSYTIQLFTFHSRSNATANVVIFLCPGYHGFHSALAIGLRDKCSWKVKVAMLLQCYAVPISKCALGYQYPRMSTCIMVHPPLYTA